MAGAPIERGGSTAGCTALVALLLLVMPSLTGAQGPAFTGTDPPGYGSEGLEPPLSGPQQPMRYPATPIGAGLLKGPTSLDDPGVATEPPPAAGATLLGPAVPGAAVPGAAVPGEPVAEVRVVGLQQVSLEKILTQIKSRAGRPYDGAMIEEDVRRLNATKLFFSVKTYTQRAASGCVIIFEVLERPVIQYVKYVGNETIHRHTLAKKAEIKPGDAMDPYSIEEARRRVEDFYHEKGFPKARVTLVEGDKKGDRGAIFLINEGTKQKYLWTNFIGNTISDDARLRTQIQSKPGFLWIFKGDVDRKQIEEDQDRLTAYYRSLGFFRARIGHELNYDYMESRPVLTYVIDEGPRYKIRGLTIVGNTKFGTAEIDAGLKLRAGDYFNQAQLNADIATISDLYGAVGYVFAKVDADPRFLEQPGELDLVYSVAEGQRCRVGKVNVRIEGDMPHTKITTVLNRLSLRPGDIVDVRELRASERRLRSCGLFKVDPTTGVSPKIAFSLPQTPMEEEGEDSPVVAGRPAGFRGQSPGDYGAENECVGDLAIEGRWIEASAGNNSVTEYSYTDPAAIPMAYPADAPQGGPMPMPAEPYGSASQTVAHSPIVRGQSPTEGGAWQPRWTSSPAAQAAPSPVAAAVYQSPMARDRSDRAIEPAVAWAGTGSEYRRASSVVQAQYTGDRGYATPALPNSPPLPPPTRYVPSPDAYPSVPSGATAPDWSLSQPPQGSATTSSQSATASPSSLPANGYAAPPLDPMTQPVAPYQAPPVYPPPPAYQPPVYQPSPAATYNPYVGAPQTPLPGTDPARSSVFPRGSVFDPNSPFFGRPPDEQAPLSVPLSPNVMETETGRLMFSVGVNSEAGVVGSIVVDEQNFDWTRLPTSWADIRNGTAWRGAGQRFRLEAVPGTQAQKYAITFQEPYLLDSENSLGLNAFYYTRIYREYDDQRTGGRVALGRQLSPDLSGTLAFRAANVKISDPIIPTPQEIDEVLGDNALFGFEARLTHDTRDSTFLPTEGHLFELAAEQVIGSFQYPRGSVEYRRYFMLHERPDGSGRHVLSVRTAAEVTGRDTPVYEHYYIGGFSTLRGFDFRGASPRVGNAVIGGEFSLLASTEYMFPITADDMIRGVVFCDTGTVEPTITDWTDDYRVALGAGLRITIPAMGAAPIALDFAVPVARQAGDEIENFSFFVGFLR